MQLFHLISNTFYKSSLQVEKRVRFVVSALILSSLLLFSTFFFFDKVWIFIPLFIIASYILAYFSVLEGIEKYERFTLFLMPICLTVAFYLFYFLFPFRWLTRVPFTFVYGFSIYAVLLTSNIFNVGAEKSLQLHRAAFAVNYFYQAIITFLFLNVLYSFRLNFIFNGLLIFIVIFPLSVQLLWSVKPKINISRKIIHYSFLISILIAQIGIVLSFIPLQPSIYSLFLSACYYSFSGLIYHYLDERLFKQTVREYLFVLCFVVAIMLLSIQW